MKRLPKKFSWFAAWFEKQFGPRETRFPKKSDSDLRRMVEDGAMARGELERRALWEDRRTAALYAYNIKDADKGKPL